MWISFTLSESEHCFKDSLWIQLLEIILIWHTWDLKESIFAWKIIKLTVLQSCMIAYVALINLVFGCHRRKLDVPNIQDCSEYAVHTSKLLKHTKGTLAALCSWLQQGSDYGWSFQHKKVVLQNDVRLRDPNRQRFR